jgi:hypothetical protein
MKIVRTALITVLAAGAAVQGTSEVSAQAEIGVHGTLADVRDLSPGLGARFAFVRPRASGIKIGVEAKYTYYFPSCTGLECDAWGGQALLFARRPTGGGAETYLGIGAAYVNVSLDNGIDQTQGDAWGVALVVGSLYRPANPIVPFFEFDWQFMNSFTDIWELTLGLRAPLGQSGRGRR